MAIYEKGKAVKLSDNFNSTELDCKGAGCCKNTQIDAKLVEYLQMIREHFNKPITITSGYRCATHNRNVGGANGSRHTLGHAADIVVSGVKPIEVAQYAESIGIKGIGLYDSFVHIDVRTYKSFWYSDKEEPRQTFKTSGAVKSKRESIEVSLPVLTFGKSGTFVEVAQCLLGIDADGKFGNGTYKAVTNFQSKKGLSTDGVIGANTWKALLS